MFELLSPHDLDPYMASPWHAGSGGLYGLYRSLTTSELVLLGFLLAAPWALWRSRGHAVSSIALVMSA